MFEFQGNFDGDSKNDFSTHTGISLPVKDKDPFSSHNLTELETEELNDQYARSWLLSSVAKHMGKTAQDVSVFIDDYMFSFHVSRSELRKLTLFSFSNVTR